MIAPLRFVALLLIALAIVARPALAQPPVDAPAPADDPAPPPSDDVGTEVVEEAAPREEDDVDDSSVERRSGAIEDESLEEMLDLGLADTLGTTDAASRREENVLSAPASVATLDARAIRLSGARTLDELLRLLPGVYVQRTSPGNFLVALRGAGGITGNNAIVMLDGVPVNNPLDGSIDGSTIPIDPRDLERIEVVRGPVSTIYGANAYTGVIQLVSARGIGSVSQSAERINVGIDTRGRPVGTLAARHVREGRRVQHAIFGSAGYDGVFRDGTAGALEPLMRASVLGRLGFTTDAGQLDVEGSGAYSRSSALEHLVLANARDDRYVGFGQVRFTTRELPSVLSRIALFGRTQARRIETTRGSYDGFSYDGTRAVRSSIGSDVSFDLHSTLLATVGAQFDLDRVEANYIDPDENRKLRPGWGFYGRLAFDPTSRWSFTAAFRGDIPPMTGRLAFSYRGSAVYHTDNFALRVVGASAYRAPTYVEVGGRFVDPASNLILLEGAARLRNPTNDGAEIAIQYSPRVDVRLSATGWAGRMRNLVIEDFEPIVRRSFRNDDHARWVVGGDLEAAWVASDAFEISGFASLVTYPSDDADQPTVGTRAMNPMLTAGVSGRGSLDNERTRYGATVSLSTARSFLIWAGIPPTILDRSVSPNVQLTGMIEREVGDDFPVWLSFRVQSNLPRQAESPLPGASLLGTSFLLGLEHRVD